MAQNANYINLEQGNINAGTSDTIGKCKSCKEVVFFDVCSKEPKILSGKIETVLIRIKEMERK